MTMMPAIVGAVISDLLSSTGSVVPGTLGAVGTEILNRVLSKRLKEAREILLAEIKQGEKKKNLYDVEADETVGIVYRYMRAAQEGTARLNLRLMAKVVNGLAHQGNLVADKFLYHADKLASLRREEIILIATIHRHQKLHFATPPDEHDTSPYLHLRDDVERDLVPTLFPDVRTLRATSAAAMRTGYILDELATLDSVSIYMASPLLEELIALAPLDAALDAEPQ